MGSRCWDCGTKMGRCYEHGTGDCDCVSCKCDPVKTIAITLATDDDDLNW